MDGPINKPYHVGVEVDAAHSCGCGKGGTCGGDGRGGQPINLFAGFRDAERRGEFAGVAPSKREKAIEDLPTEPAVELPKSKQGKWRVVFGHFESWLLPRLAGNGRNAKPVRQLWSSFKPGLHKKLDKGHQEHGDGSFDLSPHEIACELQAEATDFAGWGMLWWHSLERSKELCASLSDKMFYLSRQCTALRKERDDLRCEVSRLQHEKTTCIAEVWGK